MQNLLRWVPSIARSRALVVPLVDEAVRVNLVDVRDVVELEAEVLTQEGHAGHVYTAAGPELLTYADVAAGLSRGTGTTIPLRVLSAERFEDEARRAGYSSGAVRGLIDYFSTLRTGQTALAVRGGDVGTITGHAPRSIEQFARDCASALSELRPTTATWVG
jgi:uncharacterized protein YbjT (DUF2867 family)